MPVTITITNNSPQALAFIDNAKNLDFVKITTTKSTKKAVSKAKKTLAVPPVFEEETPEQYAFIMELSKKINKKVALRVNEEKKLNLPFKNK